MAKENNKIKEFFEGRRRAASLAAWTHLRNRAGETSRIKLDLRFPLLNHDVQGMPESIGEAFTTMAKDASAIMRTNLNIFYEGMTLEFFTADTGIRPAVSVTGVTLDKFSVVAAGTGEKRTVDLQAVAYIPANIQLRDWAWDHLHGSFHTEAVYSQSEIKFDEAVPKGDDPDAPEDPEDEMGNCCCGHTEDKHGGDPKYPGSTGCGIDGCDCAFFDANAEEEEEDESL